MKICCFLILGTSNMQVTFFSFITELKTFQLKLLFTKSQYLHVNATRCPFFVSKMMLQILDLLILITDLWLIQFFKQEPSLLLWAAGFTLSCVEYLPIYLLLEWIFLIIVAQVYSSFLICVRNIIKLTLISVKMSPTFAKHQITITFAVKTRA